MVDLKLLIILYKAFADFLFSQLYKVLDGWYRNLNLDFVAGSEFVLDELCCSKTLEDASLDHDAHLSAKEFSFLHEMGGQEHCASLLLCDLLYY